MCDAILLLDDIHLEFQCITKVNMNLISGEDMLPSPEVDEIANVLACELSQVGYGRICSKLVKGPHFTSKEIPL